MLKIKRLALVSLAVLLCACEAKPAELAMVPPVIKIAITQAAPKKETPPVIPSIPATKPTIDSAALSGLKGKLVKDDQSFLLLLGMSSSGDPTLNYQFTESYHFPHERIKEDFRLIDANGKTIDFEDLDPFENNLFSEAPLGSGISDPRVFRFSQSGIKGPVTLEVVNLTKGVTLATPLPEKIQLKFDPGFPREKQQYDIQQTVQIIPGAPFKIRYFNPIGFNETQSCNENIKTYFTGTFYLEAEGFEYIQFSQVVPPERKSEFVTCGGGSMDHICPDFANCLTSDAELITTPDNQYELQISAYNQIIHGPWQVQFDLPK